MQDILPDLLSWLQAGERIALATVVQTWGSSPRGVGAKMGITATGKMTGSVSGGCVEGAVVEISQQVLETDQPQLLHFGVADETAWDVGLACGGTVDIFVQPLDRDLFQELQAIYKHGQTAASLTIIRGPDDLLGDGLVWHDDHTISGPFNDDVLDSAVEAARFALSEGKSQRLLLPGGKIEVFAEVIAPPATIVIVGGVHTSIVLAQFAKILGFRTIIVDPRRAFGNPDRFPHADQLVQSWPDEALEALHLNSSSAVAVLTHDPKLDDPALLVALPSPAFYVGALGSQKTQAKRRTRLLEAGLTEEQLDRLHGPIGLNIGAKTPEEIALSIITEIVAAKRAN